MKFYKVSLPGCPLRIVKSETPQLATKEFVKYMGIRHTEQKFRVVEVSHDEWRTQEFARLENERVIAEKQLEILDRRLSANVDSRERETQIRKEVILLKQKIDSIHGEIELLSD